MAENTVEQIQYNRLKERFGAVVSAYEARIVEMGVEKDLMQAQIQQLMDQHREEVEGLQREMQELREALDFRNDIAYERSTSVAGEVVEDKHADAPA